MLIGLGVLFIGAFIFTLFKLQHYRKRAKEGGSGSAFNFYSPLPKIEKHLFDALFAENELGPTIDSEVFFIGGGTGAFASTTDTETWILAGLAKKADRIFEFGTATGRTTYLMARNAPPNARIVTLTLPPSTHTQYQSHELDSTSARDVALIDSVYVTFVYNNTSVENKVTQLFGDSKQFDETPYLESFDLIFIDGSHAYSYIKSDTEKAMRMLRPGGVILWHDYRGERHPFTADVYRYLNELGKELPLQWIAETSLVGYRKPDLPG